jgi:hypothetical protein
MRSLLRINEEISTGLTVKAEMKNENDIPALAGGHDIRLWRMIYRCA